MITKFRPAFIIDLDDTLVYCGKYYEEVKNRFFDYMYNLGIDRTKCIEKFVELELEPLFHGWSFNQRFPENMARTYVYFCHATGEPVSEVVENEIREIGYSVYNSRFEPMPGARQMLDDLRKDFKLFLFTKGEEPLQVKKIMDAKFDLYFDGVWITDRKSVKVLTVFMLRNELNVKTSWVLGNSRANDILPALEVGIPPYNCIWIRSYEWEIDKAQLVEEVNQIDSLDEVLPLTRRIVAKI